MSLALVSTCVGGRRAGLAAPVLTPPRTERLSFTPYEVEAIEAIIKHGTAKKAAAPLGLSPKAVEARIGRAYDRAGVRHIAQLVAVYVTAQLKGNA